MLSHQRRLWIRVLSSLPLVGANRCYSWFYSDYSIKTDMCMTAVQALMLVSTCTLVVTRTWRRLVTSPDRS